MNCGIPTPSCKANCGAFPRWLPSCSAVLAIGLWLGSAPERSSGQQETPSGGGPLIATSADAFRVVESPEFVEIFQGQTPVAVYCLKSGSKPILWPLHGPDGVDMTRSWPMSDEQATQKQEKRDHVHHRSLWFTHGEVNDVDFWAEGEGRGQIKHQRFDRLEALQDRAVVEATNEWQKATGERVLTEKRRFTFHGDGDCRIIDCQFRVTATDGDVHFGDTKEGTFGIRVAESMKVEAGKSGEIVNAEGIRNDEAWGKPSRWVDYTGPVGEKIYGIAIFSHPSGFHFPGRWHVRGYGLFAHNPFGLKHFLGTEQAEGGGHLLPAGSSLQLAYRVLLHRGKTSEMHMADRFDAYSKEVLEDLSK